MKPISARRPSFIAPMQALRVAELPDGDWLYEVKLDGYRALAFKEVRLISRNNKPLNYRQLLDSLKLLAVEQVILDGEIVALDEKGRSSFQLLQVYKSSEQRVPLVYYVFDLTLLMRKTCVRNRFRPGGNSLPTFSKKRLQISVFLKVCRALKRTCSGSRKSLASKGWLPKD